MKFPFIPKDEMIKRLAPPTGKVRVVIDTDTYNEVDDQFALSYALMSQDRLNIEAVYAAPFSGVFFQNLLNTDDVTVPMTSDLAEGLELSYQEILKIYGFLDMSPKDNVFRGSSSYMTERDNPVDSDAARDLVKRAMSSDEPLYVIALGEITNIASAILMEPEIINKIVVVWLAGQPLDWAHTAEFNIGQDPIATQTILDCGVPLVFIPCMTVASLLTTTADELKAQLKGKSKIGTYLADTVIDQLSPEAANNMLSLLRLTYLKGMDDYDNYETENLSFSGMAPSRIIWDISVVGYMLNPLWCPSTLVPTPRMTDDLKWEKDPNRHLMRIVNYCYRDGIFGDMFAKLSKAP